MASDVNSVILIGRLVSGAEENLRNGKPRFGYVSNGSAKIDLTLAVNRSRKTGETWGEEVSYVDFTLWGRQAEALKPYLTKGKQVAIEGHLRQDRWEKDGQKFSRLSVIADNLQLLGGGGKANPSATGTENYTSVPQSSFQGGAVGFPPSAEDDFPEDIPF